MCLFFYCSSVLRDNGFKRNFVILDGKWDLPSLYGYSGTKNGYILFMGRNGLRRNYDHSHLPVSRYAHIFVAFFISSNIQCFYTSINFCFMFALCQCANSRLLIYVYEISECTGWSLLLPRHLSASWQDKLIYST